MTGNQDFQPGWYWLETFRPDGINECEPCRWGRPIVYVISVFLGSLIFSFVFENILGIIKMIPESKTDFFEYFIAFSNEFFDFVLEFKANQQIGVLALINCLLIMLIRVVRVRVTLYGLKNWKLWLINFGATLGCMICFFTISPSIWNIPGTVIAIASVIFNIYILRQSRSLWSDDLRNQEL